MRKRIGAILIASGVILLLQPYVEIEVVMTQLNTIITQYWPAGFVFLGALLLWPQKRSTAKRKRS